MSLTKRKVVIEPVMEEERRAMQLLSTPAKNITPKTAKTPTSLVKRMSRVSLSEQKNWSISKTDGTKLLLKRAILADKNEKDSPKKNTPRTPKTSISESPNPASKTSKNAESKSTPRANKKNLDEILSMELKENSDEELPTLIIRQQVPTTPKRKTSMIKTFDETPKKVLFFDDDEKINSTTRSGRVTKNPVSYMEYDTSPVKRTPRRTRKETESDDDFKPAPKTPKTPRTPRTPRTTVATPKTPLSTPKRGVTRRIVSQMTPTLRNRAHSVENIAGI